MDDTCLLPLIDIGHNNYYAVISKEYGIKAVFNSDNSTLRIYDTSGEVIDTRQLEGYSIRQVRLVIKQLRKSASQK